MIGLTLINNRRKPGLGAFCYLCGIMARDLLSRYIWLVDTVRRYGRITRGELDARWSRSRFATGGCGLPRRTFYSYRQAIAELFGIDIECDPATYEYYIRDTDTHTAGMTEWLLNSAATNSVISGSREVAGRVFIDDVPSARDYLHVFIDALKVNHAVQFDYLPYTRSLPTRGVVLEPYFMKIFRQRWYATGRNVAENMVKTYALDRMSGATLLTDRKFTMPADFDPESYFRDSFGIIFDKGEVRRVVLRVDAARAKYLRALPLHHSQQELMHDSFSIFTYRIKVTGDFVSELLSMGPQVTVLEPPELRRRMVASLTDALARYGDAEPETPERPETTIG